MATQVVGSDVWKVESAITDEGAVVGWTFRGKKVRRLQLGFAWVRWKEDGETIDWDLERHDANLRGWSLWHVDHAGSTNSIIIRCSIEFPSLPERSIDFRPSPP